jgi:hypothetical protein
MPRDQKPDRRRWASCKSYRWTGLLVDAAPMAHEWGTAVGDDTVSGRPRDYQR